MVGAGTSGPLVDRFGRRKITIVAVIVFIAGALGSVFALNVPLLIIARIILGLCVGSSPIFVPAYISELAPAEVRGTLASLFHLAIPLGIVIAYLMNYAFSRAGA
jgi:MFS transporter, SP family, sugar:H+ symporter